MTVWEDRLLEQTEEHIEHSRMSDINIMEGHEDKIQKSNAMRDDSFHHIWILGI